MNENLEQDPSIIGFVRPAWDFRGTKLSPYGPGWKVLFHQASLNEHGDRNSRAWVSLALIFLLTLQEPEARSLAFNRAEFRNRALDWFGQFADTDAATKEIANLADEILTKAENTRVEVGGAGGTDPKNA